MSLNTETCTKLSESCLRWVLLLTNTEFSRLFFRKALDIYYKMQKSGKDYMGSSIARTEWKLARTIRASRSPLETEAAVMEKRSLSYLEDVTGLKGGLPQEENQIEEVFDNLIFFWSR